MTIRQRLTIYWAGLLSLLLAGAAVAVFVLFQRQQWGRLDGALMEEADTAAATIAHGADAAQMIKRLSDERDLGGQRRLWVAEGVRTIAVAGERTSDLPDAAKAGMSHTIVDGREDNFRYAITPFLLNGVPAYLVDGVDARAVRESVRRLLTTLIIVLPILLAGSISIGYWLAGRALDPLVTVARALSEIKPRDLSRRLPSAAIDDELSRLIQAINALLERVERASLAERRFAVDAAHELRTPLTVLRTGIEVALRKERSAGEYTRALDTALRDAAGVCLLADDLLASTRFEHELSQDRQLVDLRGLTAEIVDAIEPLAAAKQLQLEANLRVAAVMHGNRDHLRRVIINLLDNAVRFTPERGWIRITVEARNGIVELRVADSGPGISVDDLPFIFERFFRGRRGHQAGTGLGLSLCREIVELHGGQISATNPRCGGAEFVVTLPAPSVAGRA